MKPVFTKPFNVEHAKAGAPYCLRNGLEATILKYDGRRPNCPIITIYGEEDHRIDFCVNGICSNDGAYDLVMTPLILIDGKPVFVGDELVADDGTILVVPKTAALFSDALWKSLSWPVKREPYPKTTMSDNELKHSTCNHQDDVQALRTAANSALRRAIDTRHVVTIAEHGIVVATLHAEYAKQRNALLKEFDDKRGERDLYIAQEMRRNFGMKPEVIQEIMKKIK